MEPLAKIPAESLTKIATRAFKRLTGQPVGIKDYDKIWAEAAAPKRRKDDEDGFLLKISALRIGADEWKVIHEKYCATYLKEKPAICSNRLAAPEEPRFHLETFPAKTMTTKNVIALMKAHDPEPRDSHQHYSRAVEFI